MTLGVLIVLVVLIALVCAVLVVALPRMRTRPRRRGPRFEEEEAVGAGGERLSREEGGERLSREERVLMREGEAIRDHVEARLRAEGAAGSRRVVRPAAPSDDALAWQIEQEQRERYPASFDAGGPPRSPLSARDELAWQIERDQRERDEVASRDGVGRPMANSLQPELLPVSDPLELQLQEIAVRSRWARMNRRRRRRVPPGRDL